MAASPFDYDASVPFDVKVNTETGQDGVTILDLSYAAYDPVFAQSLGGRTVAYLVVPPGEGPFAGILYLHGFTTNQRSRNQFLDEAVSMAQHGAVCLLLHGIFPWMSVQKGTADDRQPIIGQLIELRRAVDFLLDQPSVDPARIGFVGQDYGAIYGGTLSGVDHRLKTYVLVGGPSTFANQVELGFSATLFDNSNYLPLVQDLDPIQYVANAAPASLFFQFGKGDRFITLDEGNQYYNAASEPKKIAWYDDTHDMVSDAVVQDRQAWLTEALDLMP